jgi:hypothetical protein
MHVFNFTEDDIVLIREQRLQHAHVRFREKLDVLGLKSKGGASHTEIARLTDLGRRTVQRYLDEYLTDG